ncbi:flagellar hook-associated protein FlgL [Chromobacterium violaceum]|uniref:Hook-filament junction protein n=2 Tax=Chromobacterium violaceum TaxID=536 RepID=A0A381EXJ9_CHRVL|nr:flagellar hook-associated protein FlgL [Chromobacterium violaceum]AAQ59385.1 flagellar hook-associated protein 3 [Chromobacterium violaceum ATCC 12472]MBP4050214.1 flagellar hook-associated protein FlgL [Chromobacterium violaceum]MBT2866949.1 flagellar hook-associated protein FlgL [Chromobacterium violaceum]OLZ84544.1 flagellar hook-associated protein 3 [Chromobacterium violaceum]OQS12083.1 flagellar hook-associated protein 3 [Chromobacterium violaceum]
MRISSNQYQSVVLLAMQNSSAGMSELLQKMSSGQSMLVPSENPIASVRLLRLQREEASLQQYRDNIGALKSQLTKNETLLDGISANLRDARDLLVAAANQPPTDDLKAMASPLVSLRDSILYAANTKDSEGRYMFSGSAVNNAAIVVDDTQPAGSRYRYNGNGDRQRVTVGEGVTEASNVTLESMAPLLNQLDKAIATLQSPTLDSKDPAVGATIREVMGGVDTALDRVGGTISELGGAQNVLKTLDGNHDSLSLANQESIIELGSLDYGTAYIAMNNLSMALQTSQKAYGKVSQLTLFDVI